MHEVPPNPWVDWTKVGILILLKGHVNNVMYNRYAESARVNWTLKFAAQDPAHKKEWMELMSPNSIGLILRSIKTDYKFVSLPLVH